MDEFPDRGNFKAAQCWGCVMDTVRVCGQVCSDAQEKKPLGFQFCQEVVTHTCYPSLWEAEAGE